MSKLCTSDGLIAHLAETQDVVIKTHSSRGRDAFALKGSSWPVDPGVCAWMIVKGILVPEDGGLFGNTDAQTYRLAASWGGAAQLQAAE